MSYFKLHVRWSHSFTPVTYQSKLPGIRLLAAWFDPFGLRDPQKIHISKSAPYFGRCWLAGVISFQEQPVWGFSGNVVRHFLPVSERIKPFASWYCLPGNVDEALYFQNDSPATRAWYRQVWPANLIPEVFPCSDSCWPEGQNRTAHFFHPENSVQSAFFCCTALWFYRP